jgi:exodeoxyribonuclease-3
LKIATWNVNSLRVRLPHVLSWVVDNRPDVLCLQETKIVDGEFPADEIREAGYQAVFSGQKTYNGVAILSRSTPRDMVFDLPGMTDPQRRLLAATVDGARVINVYVPNGSAVGSDKYDYKLEWLAGLSDFAAAELKRHPNLVIAGDYNIAPEDRDVHDPELWEGSVLVSGPEREAFSALLDHGLHAAFRKFDQPDGSFTWWDYRAGAFRRNQGLRIDHILCSRKLYENCTECRVDTAPRKLERPSDHAPVVASFGK